MKAEKASGIRITNRSSLHAAGKAASFVELSSPFGHDSFLLDAPEMNRVIDGFLKAGQKNGRRSPACAPRRESTTTRGRPRTTSRWTTKRSRRARLLFRATALSLMVNVGLNLWLIPMWHRDGAALATVGGEVVALVTLLWGLRRVLFSNAARPAALSPES